MRCIKLEKQLVEVKEFNNLLKIICWIMAGIFLIVGLLMVCIEFEKEYISIYIITFLIGIIFFFIGLFAPLFCNYIDIYTPQKMYRIKKGKLVFEILWEDVQKITYTKPTFLSWFSFGGGYAFFIYCRKEFTNKGILAGATVLNAHYKVKDVYAIQRIIPVHINM